MDLALVFALTGLASGALYAGLGASVVVVHRATGVISFASGALAMWAAYVYDELERSGDLTFLVGRINVGAEVPAALAALAGVGSAAVVALAAYALVFRPLRRQPALAGVVASVGLMIALQAAAVLRFGSEERAVEGFLSGGILEIGDLAVPWDRFELAGIVIAAAAALWAYFRFTLPGLATRAAAENERGAMLTGFSPDALAAGAWVLSGAVAGLVGVLLAPATGLNATNLTLAVVPALAVALAGRLRSFGVVCAAGLVLGMVQSELGYLQTKSWYPSWAVTGAGDALPFLLAVGALALLGKRLPERGSEEPGRLPAVARPHRVLAPAVALALGSTIAIFVLEGSYRFGLIQSLIVATIALSIVLLTGYIGQLSLAQAAFAGASGFLLSKLTMAAGLGFPLAPLIATGAAGLLGFLVGLPALRIRGPQLAVVTLAAAVAIERFVFSNPSLTSTAGNLIPSPRLLGLDLGVRGGGELVRVEFGLLALTVLVAVTVAVANLARSATGRRFLVVRSNERAAAAAGVDVARTKLLAFVLSSLIAGLGGVLLGYSRGQLSAESFSVFAGLQILVFAYLGGITSIGGALLAGVLAPLGIGFVLLDRAFDLERYYLLFSGLSLIAFAVLAPQGIAGTAGKLAGRLLRVRRGLRDGPRPGLDPAVEASPPARAGAPVPSARPVPRASAGASALALRELTVAYGGHVAVNSVSLQVAKAEVAGLIGPNGAGKTSLIDAVTGFLPYEGEVALFGEPLEGMAPHDRARLGLARTWQSVEQFDDLSLIEGLQVAAERPSVAGTLLDVVRPQRRGPDVRWALELVGLGPDAERSPVELSLGHRKLAGVARAIAARPALLLLDEPAAGLDSHESRALGECIRRLADHGISVLLVDHDVDLVFDVCDTVHVLDFGTHVAFGSPAEIRVHPAVRSAYLGETESAELSACAGKLAIGGRSST